MGSIYNIMPMVHIRIIPKSKKPTPVGIGVLVGKDKRLGLYTNTPRSASHQADWRNHTAWLLAVVAV